MYPILFKIGSVDIETYGVITVFGYWVMVAFLVREARRLELDPVGAKWNIAWATVGSLVGGRLLYVIVNFQYIADDPVRAIRFWEGGLVSTGSLMGMHAAAAMYAVRGRMPLWTVLDLASLAGAIALAIGRWGCFFAGCDYGKPAGELPWGVVFRDAASLVPAAMRETALHPVQLYLSLANVAVFAVGYVAYRKLFARRPGTVFGVVAVLYSVFRFVIEFWRGDADRGFFFSDRLSTSQVAVIVWAVLGLAAIVFARRSEKSRPAKS